MRIKVDKADRVISLYIKELNEWQCMKCLTCYDRDAPYVNKSLQCSHFWGRGNEMTRFDLGNLDPLCFGCHIRVESNKQGWYRDYMIRKLGPEGYAKLRRKASSTFGGHKKTHRKKQYELWKENYLKLCEEKGVEPKKC